MTTNQPTMPATIDLNCDLGEGSPHDELILPLVSSVSIACGLHAGDPSTIRRTITSALEHRVAVGAHPSFPDREGFGRRALALPPAEIHDLVVYQIGALATFVRLAGARLAHVKPHGALYNLAADDRSIADAVARATAAVSPTLMLLGLPGSALEPAARAAGLRFCGEAFVDRGYDVRGRLAPRDQPGAQVAGSDDELAARAVALVRTGLVASVSGELVPVTAQTLCLHGDDPRTPGLARALRTALAAANIGVRPLGAMARTPSA